MTEIKDKELKKLVEDLKPSEEDSQELLNKMYGLIGAQSQCAMSLADSLAEGYSLFQYCFTVLVPPSNTVKTETYMATAMFPEAVASVVNYPEDVCEQLLDSNVSAINCIVEPLTKMLHNAGKDRIFREALTNLVHDITMDIDVARQSQAETSFKQITGEA